MNFIANRRRRWCDGVVMYYDDCKDMESKWQKKMY